jgi:hypothetical protein
MDRLGTFALGVLAALVARAAGPVLARRARPLAREAIKQAIILGDGARARAEGLREDWEDLVAEARAAARAERPEAETAAAK